MAELRTVISAPLDLKDLFDRWAWQEAIFLTYSFDLPFFEAYVLPRVARGGGRSVAVAACTTWLPERVRTWAAAGEIREAGQSYTLSQVSTGGVFHPKVILAASEDRGLVLVGSGNMSEYGMATGGELFTVVEWAGNDVPALAREAWQLCRGIAIGLSVDRTFVARVEAIGQLVPGLAIAPEERTLLHNLEEPILDQFLSRVGEERVGGIVAWSPFTDRGLRALERLVEGAQPARVTLAVQPGITRIDGATLSALREKHSGIAWEVLESQVGAPHGRVP